MLYYNYKKFFNLENFALSFALIFEKFPHSQQKT